MKKVTIDDVVSTVKELAKKYPNARYCLPKGSGSGGCENVRGIVENGPPEEGCIIGQSLRILGVPEDLIDGEYGVEESLDLCSIHYESFGEMLPITFLIEVQENQDTGDTWGDAVEKATEAVEDCKVG